MKIEDLIFQLENVFDGKPWYGKNIVEIMQLSDTTDSRILDIVNHMLAWRIFALKNCQGEKYEIAINSTADWPVQGCRSAVEAVDKLKENNRALVALLQRKDDPWLHEKIPSAAYNYAFLLEGLIQHDIYHLGQIAILQKIAKLPPAKNI